MRPMRSLSRPLASNHGMSERWTVADIPLQNEKRFLITGANSGIGYAAAVELAKQGAVVILACRDQARGMDALARLRTDAAGENSAAGLAEMMQLDLASLDSIRQGAAAELERGRPLHGLINNAGVYAPPKRRETKDGFELQFGTNVLGHFALTCQLMPAIDLARGSRSEDLPRIVTIASIAHRVGRINFDDLQAEQKYSPRQTYSQSKLADLMFALELDRKLRDGMRGVMSVAAHPGVAKTNLFKLGSSKGLARVAERAISGTVGLLLNSELDGALPTLYAATSPEVASGGYYGPQGFQETRGGDVGPAKIAPQALDEAAQQRLWDVCEQATGCRLR